MTRTLILIVALVATGALAAAQSTQALNDTAVASAIAAGSNEKPGDVGLFLKVNGFQSWASSFGQPAGSAQFSMANLFAMAIHTPDTWVALHAAIAKAEYRPFGSADATAEMREPVLRVLITPTSVDRAVIRSTSDNGPVIQPVSQRPCPGPMPFDDNVGACNEFVFSLADLGRVRASDRKGEFYVTVFATGSNWEGTKRSRGSQDFKIKTKHFDDLGWE